MIVAGSFSIWGLYALAQSVIDSFTDTTRVASTWNVTVDTGTGEAKLSTRTCDDGIWFCSDSTTCVDTLGDGGNIIVKRTNETATQWKTSDTACDKPWCGTDGGQNGDNLVADNTVNFLSYPARDACKAAGGRLPTLAELQCIYTNRVTFGDNFGTSAYWSSTEYSATGAGGVRFSGGSTYSDTKSGSYSVRCVRGW
jgi:hypothetical protein